MNAIAGSPRQILLAGEPALRQFGLQPGDLQENLLLDAAIEEFCSGQVVQVGETARIRLMELCEPCASLDKIQPGLSKRISGHRGFLGMVVQDGVIWRGDRLTLTTQQFPPIPSSTRGKFEEFVSRIPPGRVVRTTELLMAMGLTQSYARSIPIWIKKSPGFLPVHRIIAANRTLLLSHLPEQAKQLQQEGVKVLNGRVSLAYDWEPCHFHAL